MGHLSKAVCTGTLRAISNFEPTTSSTLEHHHKTHITTSEPARCSIQ